MILKFPESEYKLNEEQIQRFSLFKSLNNDTFIKDFIIINRFESEFKDLINPDFKLDFSDISKVENYHSAASYFSDSNLSEFYKSVYQYELHNLESQIQQFYAENLHTIHWRYAILNPNLSDNFYEKYLPKEHYPVLVNCKFITSNFIERHINDLNWFGIDDTDLYKALISGKFGAIKDMIRNNEATYNNYEVKIKDNVDGVAVKSYTTIDNFIKELRNPIVDYWYTPLNLIDNVDGFAYGESILSFLANAKLSEEFIEKYKDDINWDHLSANPHLTMEFWSKHMDKINMKYIWRNFHVTQEFAEKHIDQVKKSAFSQNPNFSESFYEQHLDKIDWDVLFRNTGLSREFLAKYQDRMTNDANDYLRSFDEFNTKDEIDMEVSIKCCDCIYAQNPNIPENLFIENPRLISEHCYLRNPGLSPNFFRKHVKNIKSSRYLSENTFTYYKQKTLATTKKYSFDDEWKIHVKIPKYDYTCYKGIS